MAHLYLAKYKEREQTIYLPNGEKAKLTITPTSEESSVRHIEHGDTLDAIVRPATHKAKVGGSDVSVELTQDNLWRLLRQHWKATRIRRV
jgi:hypothetical protein